MRERTKFFQIHIFSIVGLNLLTTILFILKSDAGVSGMKTNAIVNKISNAVANNGVIKKSKNPPKTNPINNPALQLILSNEKIFPRVLKLLRKI